MFFHNRARYVGVFYLFIRLDSVLVTTCYMVSNIALAQGGALLCYNSKFVKFSNCVILRNKAGKSGGGLATLKCMNVIYTNNTYI